MYQHGEIDRQRESKSQERRQATGSCVHVVTKQKKQPRQQHTDRQGPDSRPSPYLRHPTNPQTSIAILFPTLSPLTIGRRPQTHVSKNTQETIGMHTTHHPAPFFISFYLTTPDLAPPSILTENSAVAVTYTWYLDT